MASDLENAMSTIVQVFHDYGPEGDCLNLEEFHKLMTDKCSAYLSAKCQGPDTSEDECIQNLFTEADSDEDGCITFSEFCTILTKLMENEHDSRHRR
ncbi:protein S100-A8-like [Pelodiscus sinensis]|uniref:protein S100-A8-like n=1 Tax=Pelodiscus sinensis TaxID=13735 RepID=UPI003F6CA715